MHMASLNICLLSASGVIFLENKLSGANQVQVHYCMRPNSRGQYDFKEGVQNAPFALPRKTPAQDMKNMKSACKSCTQMEELSIVVIAIA